LTGISFFILSFNESSEDDSIFWMPNKVLSWSDFQGIPNYRSGYGAITSSGIGYDCHFKGSFLTIEVRSKFFKRESWVKVNGKDQEGLKHEQGHFDIAEIYARKLRKTLQETTFTRTNIKYKLNDIYKQNSKAWGDEENLYDKETDHHRNRSNQYRWNERIAIELSKLENYSSPAISAMLQ